MPFWTTKPPPGIQINRGHPLARGLAGCWLMNEGGGQRTQDVMRGRISNVFTNTPTWLGERSLRFASASSQRIDLPDNICVSNGNAAFSVAAMIRTTTTTGNRDIWGEGHGSAAGLAQLLHNSGNQIELSIRNDAGTIPGAKTTVSGLTDGKWHIVVGTYTGSGGEMRVYTDGILRASSTGPSGALTSTLSTLGAIRYNGGTTNYWDGDIAFVYLWQRALLAQEIVQLTTQPYAIMQSIPTWRRFLSAGSPYYYYANQMAIGGGQ